MKKDIQNREDIELLINTFYYKVQQNAVIGPVFNEVAKVDWKTHLPKMYSFWATLLLGEQSFSGNPMRRHIALSMQTPMTSIQYNEWLSLFYATVDDLFEGDVAEEAKRRASNIARNMLANIEAASGNQFPFGTKVNK